MGKIMEKFTDSVARKIWNQMEEEQRKCEESKIQIITEKQITEFGESLYETEHSDNTIQRYCQEVRKFMEFLDGRVPEKQLFVEYRNLEKEHYNVRSVNVKISAINAYFAWSKRPELKMHLSQRKGNYLRKNFQDFLQWHRKRVTRDYICFCKYL